MCVCVSAVCGETREKNAEYRKSKSIYRIRFFMCVDTVFVDRYLANVAYVYDGGTVTRETRMKMYLDIYYLVWLSEVCVCVVPL